jgi:hypothetical protein
LPSHTHSILLLGAQAKAKRQAQDREEQESKMRGEEERHQQVHARRLEAKSALRRASTAVKTGQAPPEVEAPPVSLATAADGEGTYYTIEQLVRKSVPGLDYVNREIYISPDDCMALFDCTKEEFSAFPKWKKTKLKRSHKLF